MKNTFKVLGFIALVAVIGFSMAACGGGDDDGGVTYDPVAYTGKDSAGATYTLTITKNTGKAAFTPEKGDLYSLVITYADGTTKTSTGKVSSLSSTTISFEGATSVSFAFTVTHTERGTITKIEGTIPIDGGGTVAAPGTLQGGETPPPVEPPPVEPPPVEPPPVEPPPPPANPFANTTWKSEMQIQNPGTGVTYNVVMTLSFGTDTFTWEQRITPPHPTEGDRTESGTYTASGNTAAMTGIGEMGNPFTIPATISGNVLTVIIDNTGAPIILTRVN
jgi:hypothetical protein